MPKQAVTKTPGRPTLAQAKTLTQRIVTTATRIFLDKGYAATSMEEIALAAGTAKRTLYSRFPAKSDLFRAVVIDYSAKTLGVMPQGSRAGAALADSLYDHCIRLMEIALAPDVVALQRIIRAEVERFPELAASFEFARDQALDHLTRRLSGAVEAGEIALADVRFAAQQLMALTVEMEARCVGMGLAPAHVTPQARERCRGAVQLFLHGCATGK